MKKYYDIRRSLLLVVLMLGLVGTGYALTQPTDSRSRAVNDGISSQFQYPKIHDTRPYVRLFVPLQLYTVGEEVTVYILLHTQEKEVTEADISITYDPKVLEVIDDSIQKTSVFTTLQTQPMSKGLVSFVLFTPLDQKTPGVLTATDTVIATVSFLVLSNQEKSTAVQLFTDDEKGKHSALYGSRTNDKSVYNILQSVYSTQIKIQ